MITPSPAAEAPCHLPRLVCFVNDIYDQSMAGGDVYFYFTASAAIQAGHPVHFFGGHALKDYLERWKLPKNHTITDSGPGKLGDFSTLPGQFRLFWDFTRRFWGTLRRLKEVKPDDLAYVLSDYWFDAIPLTLCRAKAKILYVGMMAPTLMEVLFKRRADVTSIRLPAFYFWLSQQLSLRWFRHCQNGFVTYGHPEIRDYLLKFGYQPSQLWPALNGSNAETADQVPTQPKQFDVVWVGRVHPQKGIDDLLETFVWIRKQLPDFKALIIGNAKKKLEPVVQAMGLADCVTFSGMVSETDKFRLLKSSRLFLMPSHYESWGIVVGEALVSGVPVLAYKLDCYPAVFGQAVRYVTPFDREAFKQAAEDEIRRQRAGQNYLQALDWTALKNRLSWSATQKDFCHLLSHIVQLDTRKNATSKPAQTSE